MAFLPPWSQAQGPNRRRERRRSGIRSLRSSLPSALNSVTARGGAALTAEASTAAEDVAARRLCGLEGRVIGVDLTERTASALTGSSRSREVGVRHVISVLPHACSCLLYTSPSQ